MKPRNRRTKDLSPTLSPFNNRQKTAFELALEFSLSFTRQRKTTYDRFLLFTCKQKENEKLENFHCRLKALGAKCRLGTARDDLINNLFIALMSNADVQRELLMQTRTSLQILQFALNRGRGQDNQRAINNQLNCHQLLLSNQISFVQTIQTPPRNPRQSTQFVFKKHNAAQRPQNHEDGARYSSLRNTYNSARLRRSNATYANKSDTTVKCAIRLSYYDKANK